MGGVSGSNGTDNKFERKTRLEVGADIVREHVQHLPATPGVYRMLDKDANVLYVGKAKALKSRVRSYANTAALPLRLQRMVAQVHSMEFVHTKTESEALLLEANLIKKLQPKFNILLRDDKSFPYILMTSGHDFPTVVKHRGAKKHKGKYYGPFASAGDVNRTIAMLQRIFMLRNCSDNVFAQRSRPCLQYHIKRCTAPCVGLVSKPEYAAQLEEAQMFLEGHTRAIQERLAERMQQASAEMRYEDAARLRDRIHVLTNIQARQDISMEGLTDCDVLALTQREGVACVQVFFFRGGLNHGNRAYYPRHDKEDAPKAIMSAFIAQFYQGKSVPRRLLVSVTPDDKGLLQEVLSEEAGHRVVIESPSRGKGRRALDFAERNAGAALKAHLAIKAGEAKLLEAFAEEFDLETVPERIEVYDNSHISGTNMVGGMIVSGPEGFEKGQYRKFNIKESAEADDFGMMREVLERRFKRLLDQEEKEEHGQEQGSAPTIWPDVVMIDGGIGQFNAAQEVLEDIGVYDRLTLIAIAKGPDRNAGREEFFTKDRKGFSLQMHHPVLHYLQRLRDEAHRFAIGTHRARRTKQITSSPLDDIEGIGPKRKKALLLYFGSAKAVGEARAEDIAKVSGVSEALAQKIYDAFHS